MATNPLMGEHHNLKQPALALITHNKASRDGRLYYLFIFLESCRDAFHHLKSRPG